MLDRAHRVVSGDDYRLAVRRGRRRAAPSATVHVLSRSTSDGPPRFGFIVSKAVGNAVIRNRVRRRLKAICFEFQPHAPDGVDIVIRALPAAAQVPWATLQKEITELLTKDATRP